MSAFKQLGGGIPLNKLVVGKGLQQSDVNPDTYNTPEEINKILTSAKANDGYQGGVMTWQWPGNLGAGKGKAIAEPWLQTVTEGF